MYDYLGAFPIPNAAFGPGSSSQPIVLDDVRCHGIEFRLIDCRNSGILNSNCDHSKDAGVSCLPGTFSTSHQEGFENVYMLYSTILHFHRVNCMCWSSYI